MTETTIITGATIWDASGADPFVGDVLVNGNRIGALSRVPGQISASGAEVVDGSGLFLMPGMTEGHAHLSFDNFTQPEDLITPPPEEHTLLTARVAKKLLDHGFTSAYGASEAKLRLGVAVRNEVDAGRIPGPRIKAGSLEITVSGGLGDESRDHNPRIGPSWIVDGPEEMRKAVRLSIRAGCDNIKLDVSGDPFYPSTPSQSTPMSIEEVRAAVETAHNMGRKVNAHTRSIQGTMICLEAGVDVLFHCEYSDERMLDAMEAAKDRIFVAPTVGLLHQMGTGEGAPFGVTIEVATAMGIPALLDESIKTHTALRQRGIRHVIGGDYGFGWGPQGDNARDIGFFVKYFGYSSAEALVCATRNGGAQMTMGTDEKLGEIKQGYLADLLLVDGDPIADSSVLLDPARLMMIMKDGKLYKNTRRAMERRAAA